MGTYWRQKLPSCPLVRPVALFRLLKSAETDTGLPGDPMPRLALSLALIDKRRCDIEVHFFNYLSVILRYSREAGWPYRYPTLPPVWMSWKKRRVSVDRAASAQATMSYLAFYR